VARAYIAETQGVYQDPWTIDAIDQRIDAIRAPEPVLDFGLHGHVDHIRYSFAMQTAAEKAK
jgi:hypothetical protein